MSPRQPLHVLTVASLANYDGSAGTLVNTNIWVGCTDAASPWHEWAVEQLQRQSERAPLHINLVIFTKLLVPGPDVDALDALLGVLTRDIALPELLFASRSGGASNCWVRRSLTCSS